jgi:hypothetical protein
VIVWNVDSLRQTNSGSETGARPATERVSDAEFYREISAIVSEHEPRAGKPMRALFEQDGSGKVTE